MGTFTPFCTSFGFPPFFKELYAVIIQFDQYSLSGLFHHHLEMDVLYCVFNFFVQIIFRSTPMSRKNMPLPRRSAVSLGGHLPMTQLQASIPHLGSGLLNQHLVVNSAQDAVLAIDSTMMEAFQFQESLGSLVLLRKGFKECTHMTH